MNNLPKTENEPFRLCTELDLKSPYKASHNRNDDELALHALVTELAKQAAQKDFEARHTIH